MTRPSETQMHEQPNSSDHARHDLLAVAALVDRDATGEEAARARAQVDACTECATLHAELISLATVNTPAPRDGATPGLPAPAGGCPAAAPESVPSTVRIVRDGPRRLQPAAGHGPHDARHRRADARDPAGNAVVRRCGERSDQCPAAPAPRFSTRALQRRRPAVHRSRRRRPPTGSSSISLAIKLPCGQWASGQLEADGPPVAIAGEPQSVQPATASRSCPWQTTAPAHLSSS